MVFGGVWQDFGELGREQSQGPLKLMVCGGFCWGFGELGKDLGRSLEESWAAKNKLLGEKQFLE